MLTKEQFVYYMNELKTLMESGEKLSDALKYFDNCTDFGGFSNFRAENMIIELLEKLMGDGVTEEYAPTNISYFIFDLEWGTKWDPECFTEQDGTPIDISTVEKLYDYLKSEIENKMSENCDI